MSMDAAFVTCSQEGSSWDDLRQDGSQQQHSDADISQESNTMGAGAANRHADHTFCEVPETLPAAEARFKQLASLHLLKATYQQEEDREVNRLSVERVLQSAQKQNSAHKIRLAFMQQHISDQLRIVEAQERRLAELLSHLQILTSQPFDLSTEEDAIIELIWDMNNVRSTQPPELPAFMTELISFGTSRESLNSVVPMRTVSQIFETFILGQAAACRLQFSLPHFNGQSISLQEMSTCSPDTVFRIMDGYKAAIKAQLPHANSSDPMQKARALEEAQHMADELLAWQVCLIVGQQPSDVASHHPWFRKTPVTSMPLDIMQDALDQADFREEQVAEIQRSWQQHRCIRASLEEGERSLRMQLRGQLNQAAGLADCQGLYMPMMDTVAELKNNWKAQASSSFVCDFNLIATVVDPPQVAIMLACLAPYPFRFDLILSAGLMQPKTAPPPPTQLQQRAAAPSHGLC